MREAGECLSVFDQEFSAETARAILAQPREKVELLVEELVSHELLARRRNLLVFASPRVRELLHASLPETRKRALHAQAAALLEARGAAPSALFPHYLEARNREQAVRLGLAAVDLIRKRGRQPLTTARAVLARLQRQAMR